MYLQFERDTRMLRAPPGVEQRFDDVERNGRHRQQAGGAPSEEQRLAAQRRQRERFERCGLRTSNGACGRSPAGAALASSTSSKRIRCREVRSAASAAGMSKRRSSRSGSNGKTNTRAGTPISRPLGRSGVSGPCRRRRIGPTRRSGFHRLLHVDARSQASYSSPIDSIATTATLASSAGNAMYSNTHARYTR
jgi:hypothetical protein